MQTVAETPTFVRQAAKLFSDDEHKALINFLATYPLAGDEIPGTSGAHKVRFGAKGKGKSGGARVIYYYFDEGAPIYALLAYGKGERTNLTPDETKNVAAFAQAIKATFRKKRR